MINFFELLFGKNGGMTNNELNKMSARNKFSDYLPWIAYDPKTKTYHNTDDTIGYIWECVPLAFASDKTMFILEGLFRMGLPEKSVLQFILFADPHIKPFLDAYKRNSIRENTVVSAASESFSNFISNGVEGMASLNGIPVRNFRLFVCVKIPKETKTPTGDVYNTLQEALKGATLFPEPLSPGDLIDWMRRIFNDNVSDNNNHYDLSVPIRKQVIFSETVISKDMNNIKIGERYFRCTTAKNFPKEVNQLQTNELFGGIWGITSDTSQIPTPFLHTFNICFHNLKHSLHSKCSLLLQQQAAGSFAPSIKRKQAEYLGAVDEIEAGQPFVRCMPIVWTWHKDERLASESIVRVKRLWEGQGYVMQEDKGILPLLFISSLPFGLYDKGKNVDNLDRDFIAPASAVANVLPIQADFAGGGKPYLIFIGRKGQICTLDIFDSKANNHNIMVAATSGSGKSFLINNLTFSYFAGNSLIRIIDIGGSYKKMTTMFNARYLDFDKKSTICLNPFTRINTEDFNEELSVIASIVLQMTYSATDLMPDDSAETEMSLIKAAVRGAFRLKGNDTNIDDVYRYLIDFPGEAKEDDFDVDERSLEKFKDLSSKIAFNLQEFTSKGTYGKWFNGKSTFDISGDEFVVLELEALKPQKELFKVVTLQIINAVTQDLYLSDRSRKRLVVFDEAWQFLREGSSMKDVVEEGYRRARKYGGAFAIITQSLLDLKAFGSVGDVIRANSAFIFLPESPDFDRARDLGLIDFDEFTMKLLKSVKSNRPKYSEIFVQTPFGPGIVRLTVDPYSYYVYTSDAREIAEIENMVSEGVDYAEAIAIMVKKYKS